MYITIALYRHIQPCKSTYVYTKLCIECIYYIYIYIIHIHVLPALLNQPTGPVDPTNRSVRRPAVTQQWHRPSVPGSAKK